MRGFLENASVYLDNGNLCTFMEVVVLIYQSRLERCLRTSYYSFKSHIHEIIHSLLGRKSMVWLVT